MSLLERPTARAISLHQIPRSSGAVVWEGYSPIDDAPIVAIVVWHSRNVKTADMAQTFILRSDMKPTDALANGEDASICGDCKHRGSIDSPRTCYVEVGKSVNAVYRCYAAGNYPTISPGDASAMIAHYRAVRLGAYGDPAMVPASVWDSLVSRVSGYTGYTHQWRTATTHRHLCMASVDSPEEHAEAQAQGWRTFRVRKESEPTLPGEAVCPASAEGGNRTTCDRCRLCSGASGRRGLCSGITIYEH
ncbi:hypothetical protein UFOVP995_39 [uncultured Caudovirales phage]|uniref:Uncharacterized protein n=1 Tax=uncultured Caudovirales phage TaxID=2100421 RepID=A0A6J5Q4V9_9CAUD|nr:hypothetical protein UFOVP995_39 [uncultured Caudovirales phage]